MSWPLRSKNVRRLRGDVEIPARESLRQMIISIERGGAFGDMWRSDLAAAFGREPDELFSVPIASPLPHPLLLRVPVDEDVLSVITAQRAAHIQAEHAFGPQHARPLVERDLDTVEALIKAAPRRLKLAVAEAAGTIAEVAGWIAQDLGDHSAAQNLTHKAFLHLRMASPEVQAMILMRQSNILAHSEPGLAVDLAADAADLIDGRDPGRLQRVSPASKPWQLCTMVTNAASTATPPTPSTWAISNPWRTIGHPTPTQHT